MKSTLCDVSGWPTDRGKKFDGETVLRHMAERSGITAEELSDIFDSYITEGLASDDRP